jgi:hypothetical protein
MSACSSHKMSWFWYQAETREHRYWGRNTVRLGHHDLVSVCSNGLSTVTGLLSWNHELKRDFLFISKAVFCCALCSVYNRILWPSDLWLTESCGRRGRIEESSSVSRSWQRPLIDILSYVKSVSYNMADARICEVGETLV